MKKGIELLLAPFSWCCGILLTLSLASMLGYLFWRGLPGMSMAIIFGNTPAIDAILLKQQVFDGLFPAIVGTICLILISLLFSLPIGLAAGIYMAQYAHHRSSRSSLKEILSFFFDILAGLPSVVVGLAGFSMTILIHHIFPGRMAPCLLLSGLGLGLLILPYLIRSTQNALEAVPLPLQCIAPALGATRLQNLTRVLIPYCAGDLLGGVILALGRAAEDTAVIMLTGVVASAGIPRSLLEQFEALPFFIYYISSQYSDTHELEQGFSAAIILLIVCVLLFIGAAAVQRRIKLDI